MLFFKKNFILSYKNQNISIKQELNRNARYGSSLVTFFYSKKWGFVSVSTVPQLVVD